MTKHTLIYRRKVRKNVDHINDGLLYLHHFGTGWQELVFGTHEAARRFADNNDCEYKGQE